MTAPADQVGQLAARALQVLLRTADQVPLRCAHLAASPLAAACALHPGAGLLCTDCLERHVLRPGHDDGRCAGCGHGRLHGHGALQLQVRYAATLLPADSSTLLWSGVLRLELGLLCRRCLRRLEQAGASLATPPPAPTAGP